MTSADLLLYRPWRDVLRKDQDVPVDFSTRSSNVTSNKTDDQFTDIDTVSTHEEQHSDGKKSIIATNDEIVDSVGLSETKTISNERENESSTPDSGFSSPSDGAFASPYHLFPGLYQQALANHALQREAFYRDAIQREIISRQHCRQEDLQVQNFCRDINKTCVQTSPLSLVVNRDSELQARFNIGNENHYEKRKTCTEENVFIDSENIDCVRTGFKKGKGVNDIACDALIGSHGDIKGTSEKYAGRSSVISSVDEEEGQDNFVSPPQTSPYHLLPPSLYWPHGSTPINDNYTKSLNQFSNVGNSSNKSPSQKLLVVPGCSSSTNNVYPSASNPLASPLGRHLSNALINPLTSPLSSPVARAAYDLSMNINAVTNPFIEYANQQINQQVSPTINTPSKSPSISLKRKLPSSSFSPDKKGKSPKKTKATRKLNFDEDKSSPVSGTIIRELVDGEEPLVVRKGDIDPAYNVVEVTEEAKAEIAKIDNKIGEYVCRLCKELYDDAFGLAQHRCSRIIHVEYRCPECDKVFNCPANLASHRRWHKPKGGANGSSKVTNDHSKSSSIENLNDKTKIQLSQPSTSKASLNDEIVVTEDENIDDKETEIHDCPICFKSFKRLAYLRKHLLTHRREIEENDSIVQPIPQKYPLHHQISQPISHHLKPTSITHPHPHISHGSILSPPMLSPQYSPTETLKCHLCHLAFFTPTALAIHFATVHRRDPNPSSDSPFSCNSTFTEQLSLNNIPASSSGNAFRSELHHPQPQYFQDQTSHLSSHLMHRPSQISAS